LLGTGENFTDKIFDGAWGHLKPHILGKSRSYIEDMDCGSQPFGQSLGILGNLRAVLGKVHCTEYSLNVFHFDLQLF
jgi:hypothetical protein